MLATCPNCKEPIPWHRLFLTTAWGSWRCGKCNSLLGVNVKRRLVLVFVAVFLALLLAGWASRRFPTVADTPVMLGVFAAVLVIHFLCFERARLIERCGFRCQSCGYDLQGQVEPRCPECGREFDAGERTDMRRLSSADVAEQARRRRWVKWVGVAFLVALVAAQILGLYFWRRVGRTSIRPAAETEHILQAVLAYAKNHGGGGPRHASELLREGHVTVNTFATLDSLTRIESVPLADIMLAQFAGLKPEERKSVVSAALVGMPDATIAHRLGDFVFTYHGIDFGNADSDLWVVVWSPHPAQNPPPSPDESIPVGLAGGNVVQIPLSRFVEELFAQSQLRTRYGLPTLASPFTVTHRRPMVAQPVSPQP